MVIILFNTGSYKTAFSTDSFVKLTFCLTALFALCWRIEFNVTFINFMKFALHNQYKYQVLCAFVLCYFWNEISRHKHLNIAFNKENMPLGSFEVWKIPIYKGKCETFNNWKSNRLLFSPCFNIRGNLRNAKKFFSSFLPFNGWTNPTVLV